MNKPVMPISSYQLKLPKADRSIETYRLAASKATIKFVDEAGQTLPTDARELLGVKELERVTIRGQAKRDEAGNLTVLARQIYIKR